MPAVANADCRSHNDSVLRVTSIDKPRLVVTGPKYQTPSHTVTLGKAMWGITSDCRDFFLDFKALHKAA